ncbi:MULTISPECIES: amino acid adenylation domain-containing protein [unclassified Streptomyces]|uniref:amino acid adenylation domain-containing protein n=1 Tax=unclassified Streptomyces TaxID=2593676 RepID=UPI001488BA50|nr:MULTISPECIES: amino acid adenylation domain-containing protein [unclassified Streptomyces]
MSIPPASASGAPRNGWNETVRPFRDDATIPDLLADAARRHPDRPAIVTSDKQVLTHGELDRRSNRLARLLRDLGLGRGDSVALYGERDVSALVGLLAVLKCGAAYVPLDPAWPARRVVELLDRLDVAAVLTDRAHLPSVQELRWEVPSLRHVLCPDIPEESSWSATFQRERVTKFFDFMASAPDQLEAAGFNMRRSERPFDEQDVLGYRDHVASFVLGATAAERPAILEIGCGSGLIVEALAPRASRYVAVDPSPVSVTRSQEGGARSGGEVEGVVCFAHEVAERVHGPFDVVVLASTVQFMPDLDYLIGVLDSLLGLLADDGVIVLADLIDPELDTYAGVRVSPHFVERLPELLPGVAEARVHRRRAEVFAGELAHRYDAVIRVAPSRVRAAPGREPLWTGHHVELRPADPLTAGPAADDVCYTIFTSGSTGAPKGVVVTHRSVVNLIDWMNRTYDVGPTDRILFVTSFCFDLSVYDIFGVLAAGASVRPASTAELAEPDSLVDVLEQEDITIWDSAPAALGMVMPFVQVREPAGRDTLRLVLLSGDWVPVPLPDQIRAAFPRAQVVALGGATECTVWSNHYRVGDVDPAWPSIPYGTPMQNARYYVLDGGLRPCPVGEEGDLYIAGQCVALGYARSPHLTAARFLPDPWAHRPGERMYHTGDRARWLPSGDLEFLGRLDDQVKVRGYRIELGEVQSALLQCPGIRAASVVAPSGPRGRTLAAFYVPTAEPLPKSEIVGALRAILPSYMVPTRVVALDELPLTSTGKVDRAALLRRL